MLSYGSGPEGVIVAVKGDHLVLRVTTALKVRPITRLVVVPLGKIAAVREGA